MRKVKRKFRSCLRPHLNACLVEAESDDITEVVIFLNTDDDEEDFITMHNIIYYLHFGCLNFAFPWVSSLPPEIHEHQLPEDFPKEADPVALYKASKKFIIPHLTIHCLRYLKRTLTPSNILERLFEGDGDLRFHDELVEMYFQYLLDNYDTVKGTDSWNEVLGRGYGCDEASEFAWSILCRLTKCLVVAPRWRTK